MNDEHEDYSYTLTQHFPFFFNRTNGYSLSCSSICMPHLMICSSLNSGNLHSLRSPVFLSMRMNENVALTAYEEKGLPYLMMQAISFPFIFSSLMVR